MRTRTALFTLLAAVTVPALAARAHAAEKKDPCPARIAGIVGDCQMALDPADDPDEVVWLEAELDRCLQYGDMARTKADGHMALVYEDDGAEVRLNALSVMTVSEEDDEELEMTVNAANLSRGELWAKLQKGGAFSVRTPTAVAGVRGTEFDVAVDEDGSSSVHVLEGAVAVFNELGRVLAEEGMATEILKDMIPKKPFGFDIEKHREKIKEWKDKISLGEVKKALKEKIEEKKKELGEDAKKKLKKPKFGF
ncbi:MAG: FecR family protein [bacterium]